MVEDAAHNASEALERRFLAAYEEYADGLFRHCFIRVRDRDLAKDLVQEAFAKTWIYLSKGNEIENLQAFLYRTAHNAVIDAMRKKRTVSLDAMTENEGFEPADETEAHDVKDEDDIEEAHALIQELDDIYRIVLTMRYVDGLAPKEIAVVLGVSENVVSVRIYRGVRQLRARAEARNPLRNL